MVSHTSKFPCSSKKYVLLSWDILWLPTYFIGHYIYYLLNGKDLSLTLWTAAGMFFPLSIFLLCRLFYVNCYEDYIEIKHMLVPFWGRKISLSDLNAIALEKVYVGSDHYYANGADNYINSIVVYFYEQGKKTKKTYWNVISFYGREYNLFYANLSELYGIEFDKNMLDTHIDTDKWD